MKKGPNLRWSLIQCSGGDEGDRTPDLLTASQALSQLSYAPVRRSTIRELGRRCKDNFGKTFLGRGRRSPAGPRRRSPAPTGPMRARARGVGPRCPTKPAGRAPRAGGAAAALLSSALGTSRVPPSAAFRSRSAVRHAPGCYSTGDGPIIGSDHAFAHSAISKPCRITGLDRGPPSMPELVETKQQVEGLCISLNAGHGRPVWVEPRNPAWF